MLKLYSFALKKATIMGLICFLILPGSALGKVPSDPQYKDQELVWNQINAPKAWDYTTGSKKVIVAVIDTGADLFHNDLKNNIWINPREIADNGYDDDFNGYVDDVYGWNFVDKNNDPKTSVFDENGNSEAVAHGTVIAGLIGAEGDNDVGGIGINWDVQIMALRAIDSGGYGSYRDVAEAVNYAARNGADIISISFIGVTPDAYLKQSLYEAYKKGVVIVSAVGNATFRQDERDLGVEPKYPACFDNQDEENWIIGVSSVNSKNELSYFANYGDCVDVVAPGQNLWSTERFSPQFGYPDEFGGKWSGTSFAAPLVAGTAALVKSIHPEWTAKDIIPIILNNTAQIDYINLSYQNKLGRGLLDAGKAVAESAKTFASVLPLKSLFKLKNNQIIRHDLEEKVSYSFAKVRDAVIIDFDSGSFDKSGKVELALLIKRLNYYYVRILDGEGRLVREFSIKPTPNFTPENINIVGGGEPGVLVVEKSKKIKKVNLSYYSLDKIKLKSISLNESYSSLAVSTKSPLVTLGEVRHNKINLLSVNLITGAATRRFIAGAQKLSALKYGSVWQGEGEQLTAVFNRSGKQFINIFDVESKSEFSDGLAVKYNIKNIALGDFNSNKLGDILLYNESGGIFSIIGGRGKLLKNLNIPAF